jgi:hypothetical protein
MQWLKARLLFENHQGKRWLSLVTNGEDDGGIIRHPWFDDGNGTNINSHLSRKNQFIIIEQKHCYFTFELESNERAVFLEREMTRLFL